MMMKTINVENGKENVRIVNIKKKKRNSNLNKSKKVAKRLKILTRLKKSGLI